MGDAKGEIWKRLFNLLFNNKEPDTQLPIMWTKFKAEKLHRSDIRIAIENLKDYLHEDARKHLCDINSGDTSTRKSIPSHPVLQLHKRQRFSKSDDGSKYWSK